MFIDTHAHLYSEEFEVDREEMIQRALDNGVKKLYLPNIDRTTIEGMLALEEKYEGKCFPMMGLHPCYVKENYKEELNIVREWLDKRSFCAIGEIGIDLYWDKTFIEEQKEAFRIQINWAKEFKRPIVIHARNSMDEIMEIVEEENDDNLTGIFHCFSGDENHAKRVLELGGFYLGVGGVVTFKNSGKTLRTVLEQVDMENIVLETDAPYLSPVPYRGKRNESSYIPLVAERLSALKGLTIDEVGTITTNNAEKLFMPFV
ncbi:MAG: TatD DNase family protein [Maribacter sp.]|jgi:TatD DNase family protein